VALALLVAGLMASVFHLGQPRKAWRVWLGWRTSWLSREAIALNGFAGIATGIVAMQWTSSFVGAHAMLVNLLAVAAGVIALFAQAMVYADTGRRFWRLASTFPRFLGTAAVLGLALSLAFSPDATIAFALMLAVLVKLAIEGSVFKHADSDAARWTQLRRTAALQCGPLRRVLGVRLLAALAGGVLMPFAAIGNASSPVWTVIGGLLCFSGEIAERYLFFTSVAPDRMPGHP
jgi:DMSO reductase anchor subunit